MTSPPGTAPSIPGLEAGAVLGQARSENFPVASVLLPKTVRSHLLAIYGFARLADDIGDEVEGDRLAQLDWLESELERAAAGTAAHPILVRLTPTLAQLDLPLDPFRALIEANRVDQRVTRYQTMDDLVGYCRLSAVPVGRLVLLVFGVSTPERVALSDEVCIG
ncbi:MAG TPA: squalene/phytoene synthase family protein, partial [Acidimicrobiales bacterium]|nr:squalene/phytoene synthase family protein [Acidimicrobiales bacterium]